MSVEIISTVLVPATVPAGAAEGASAIDLTDLDAVHDELSVKANDTSNDAWFGRAITQASRAIANYCNRVFPVEVVQDLLYIQQDPYPFQVPGGLYPLQLSRWPLVDPAVIALTGNTHGTQVIDGIASTAGLSAGMPMFAGDGSISAGTVVSSLTPYSLVLSNPTASSVAGEALTGGIQVSQLLASGLTQTLVYGQDFMIDAEHGWLIRLDSWTGVSVRWEALPTTVVYRAGYATVPEDLVDACLRLVTARYRARGRDPALVQRDQPGGGMGTERYWVGNLPGQKGSLPLEVQGLVENYRVPVIR